MEDERAEEMEVLTSIYPELVIHDGDPYRFQLSLAVATVEPATVTFQDGEGVASIRQIRHFPDITLDICLPSAYPSEVPPEVTLSTQHGWLEGKMMETLAGECAKMWEEYGQGQILFPYIDHVQQSAQRLFDLGAAFTLPPVLEQPLMAYDILMDMIQFSSGTYDCGVCLTPQKGSQCHRMRSCGHVFCKECLLDFYNHAITEGDMSVVTCLEPTCGQKKPGEPARKKKMLHPGELLDMGISEEQARRYVEMRRKKALESDKSTVYCPRTWCQAPARSKKTAPIPADLRDYADSDSEVEAGDAAPPPYSKNTPEKHLPAPGDRLAVCSKCSLAFCKVCYQGWHGEFARCWPRDASELSVEEKASYDYIRLHTSPCPTCSSPTQKTMGCNHMRCVQCNTHFCYLCSAWLPPDNPYLHFNTSTSKCYMRLWELEEGDEGAAGGQFEGARRAEAEARAVAAAADEAELEALAGAMNDFVLPERAQAQAQPVAPPAQVLAGRRQLEVRLPVNVAAIPDPPQEVDMHAWPAVEDNVQLLADMLLADEDANHAAAQGQHADRPAGRRARRRAWRNVRGQEGPAHAAHNPAPAPARARNGPNAALAQAQVPREVQQQQQQRRHRRRQPHDGPGAGPVDDRARQEAALRRFVEMAQRDEEDGWDSDELDGDEFLALLDL